MNARRSISSIVPVRPSRTSTMPSPTRPLVVMSNRGPFAMRTVRRVPSWCRTVGGLVSALDPAVRARGGLWIAASDLGEHEPPSVDVAGYQIQNVALSEDESEGYYRRVANGVLWPLLHSFPTRVRTQDAPWDVYREVNARFAERAAATAPHGASVWVQDYHLLLAARELRALRPDLGIGWFDHVPWPAPEVFATLPERDEAIAGLLGADLLGFQTPRDARNFLALVQERTSYRVDLDAGTVDLGDRVVTVRAFPIGIDVETVSALAGDPEVARKRDRLREDFGHQRIFVAVDRLDYTKGMPERLRAFACMLERHPELLQRVALLQVAVPSRTEVAQYAALKREVDELVGNINGRFARPGWAPVHYLYRSFDLAELVAMYTLADVAVVTPLRDGMNLVAHEFCAARLDHHGVLVLSEFAGAATVLDGAILVNPYDQNRTADAMADALLMSPEEQEDRMRRMRAEVRKHRISHWQTEFLLTLEACAASNARIRTDRSGRMKRVQ